MLDTKVLFYTPYMVRYIHQDTLHQVQLYNPPYIVHRCKGHGCNSVDTMNITPYFNLIFPILYSVVYFLGDCLCIIG